MVHSCLVTTRTPWIFVSVRYWVSSRDGWPPTRSAFRACTVSWIVPPLPSEKLTDLHDLNLALIWPLSTVAAWRLADWPTVCEKISSTGAVPDLLAAGSVAKAVSPKRLTWPMKFQKLTHFIVGMWNTVPCSSLRPELAAKIVL